MVQSFVNVVLVVCGIRLQVRELPQAMTETICNVKLRNKRTDRLWVDERTFFYFEYRNQICESD